MLRRTTRARRDGKDGHARLPKLPISTTSECDEVIISNPLENKDATRVFLVAGLPLDQNIVQYGPFVLNTKEEVYQAMFDYSNHVNGFERAANWESEIGKSMVR